MVSNVNIHYKPLGYSSWQCFHYLQGTILDRIDYNIDNAATHTEKGLVQLQKAEKYQKKNRKMMFILILAAVIIILLIIFIAVKS